MQTEVKKIKMVLGECGAIIRKHYDSHKDFDETRLKKDLSSLTRADAEADSFLRKELMSLIPSAGWLSEETEDDRSRLNCDWVWIVDPLDGTKEFTLRIPEVAVSIGLAFRGDVVMGAVLNPITGEGAIGSCFGVEFWNFHSGGKGATDLRSATISVSRTEAARDGIQNRLVGVGKVRVVGSVAYKLLRVAAGVDDLTVTLQPKSEWDICGGIGLIKFSGKHYRRFDGKETAFNQPNVLVRSGAVAGVKGLVDELFQAASDGFPIPGAHC